MQVILISIDCLRADHVGYTKDSKFMMPFLNEMAANGQAYHNCIVPAPFTTASHASMLTGLYPFEHGIRHLNGERLSKHTRMIQHDLKQGGFSTHAVVSCFHMTHIRLSHGFDTFKYNPSVKEDKCGRGSYNPAEVVTDRAIKLLSYSEAENNFLFLHYFDAHVHVGCEYEQLYKDELLNIDREIERLVDYCKGYKKDTFFVITGDHGKKLYKGEHNFPCLNPRHPIYDPLPCDYADEGEGGHGAELYDECMKVPLILYYTQPPNNTGTCLCDMQNQISSLRIPKIIRDYVGRCSSIELPSQHLPSPKYSDPIVYMETFSPDQLFKQGIPLIGLRSNEKKTICYQVEHPNYKSERCFQIAELYNLTNDPNEKNNLINLDWGLIRNFHEKFLIGGMIPHWKAPPKIPIEDKVATRLKALGYI